MTNEELEKNWRQCVLKSFGGIILLAEKYSQCFHAGPLGVMLQIAGMDGKSLDHFSFLRVETDGKCYEEGTAGRGMHVGTLMLLPAPERLEN